MRIGTPGFIAERLTEVREARGLAQTALSELTGIKSQSISHYEQGRQSPSPEALALLCEKLEVPERYFRHSIPAFTSQGIFFTAYRPSERAVRLMAERRLGWLKEIAAWLRTHVDLPAPSVPRRSGNPEQSAADCRAALRLGDEPLPDVMLLLENMGCIVGYSGIDHHVESSFSQWDAGTPYILLAEGTSLSRVRFDAAHKLGHLVMHGESTLRQSTDAATHRAVEEEADRFARAFLLPARTFGAEVWAPTIDAVVSLKKIWNCPVSEMIVRCGEIGSFDKDQMRRALVNHARRGWKTREPHEREADAEAPRLLARGFRMLIEEGGKHPHSVLTDLAPPARDIEKLTHLPAGYFEDAILPLEAILRLRF